MRIASRRNSSVRRASCQCAARTWPFARHRTTRTPAASENLRKPVHRCRPYSAHPW
jgi:hypothetical protein